MNPDASDPKVIIALDNTDPHAMRQLIAQLDPKLCRLKVGKESFTALGPQWIAELQTRWGFQVFLDLKFHDIPNTVAKACKAAADLGVWMVNVHAWGGRAMLDAAQQAIATYDTHLIAVTVLTSLDQQALLDLGLQQPVEHYVQQLALQAQQAGLDGVVCSAQEAALLRQACGPDFLLVTPGIRPADYGVKDDQSRVVTPADAIAAGASYLVIGRPITQSRAPIDTLMNICRDI